jgi:hypothetical protein
LVDGVEPAPGGHVVAGNHERAGVVLGVELDLAQRPLEPVLVGHLVRQDRLLERPGGVRGVDRQEGVAVA